MAESRLPFGDPLAADGTLHGRLRSVVSDLLHLRITLKEASAEVEKIYIHMTLTACDWNRSEAARRLGIHRNTLNTKIEQYKIDGAGE